jgi:hypothetical protein
MGVQRRKAWFGVRTLYRLTVKGTPKWRHKYYDPRSTLVEDRVVLFRSSGFDDAIEQAQNEARAYSKQNRFENIYGQTVRMRYLDVCDAFELVDRKISDGSEVYSSTELVPATTRDSKVVTMHIRADRSGRTPRRWKFMDGKILGKALGALRDPK